MGATHMVIAMKEWQVSGSASIARGTCAYISKSFLRGFDSVQSQGTKVHEKIAPGCRYWLSCGSLLSLWARPFSAGVPGGLVAGAVEMGVGGRGGGCGGVGRRRCSEVSKWLTST